ncbi:MAG TPA: hypothetical protein VF618_00100 [Thermoanaerobaculia bacterium]
MTILLGVLTLLAIVAAVIGLLALSVTLMRKDRDHGTSGALGSAMLEVESVFTPQKRHVIESVRAEASEEDDAGGPPNA